VAATRAACPAARIWPCGKLSARVQPHPVSGLGSARRRARRLWYGAGAQRRAEPGTGERCVQGLATPAGLTARPGQPAA